MQLRGAEREQHGRVDERRLGLAAGRQPPRDAPRQPDAQQERQRGRQARGPGVVSEHGDARRDRPVGQRRLGPVADFDAAMRGRSSRRCRACAGRRWCSGLRPDPRSRAGRGTRRGHASNAIQARASSAAHAETGGDGAAARCIGASGAGLPRTMPASASRSTLPPDRMTPTRRPAKRSRCAAPPRARSPTTVRPASFRRSQIRRIARDGFVVVDRQHLDAVRRAAARS